MHRQKMRRNNKQNMEKTDILSNNLRKVANIATQIGKKYVNTILSKNNINMMIEQDRNIMGIHGNYSHARLCQLSNIYINNFIT